MDADHKCAAQRCNYKMTVVWTVHTEPNPLSAFIPSSRAVIVRGTSASQAPNSSRHYLAAQ